MEACTRVHYTKLLHHALKMAPEGVIMEEVTIVDLPLVARKLKALEALVLQQNKKHAGK